MTYQYKTSKGQSLGIDLILLCKLSVKVIHISTDTDTQYLKWIWKRCYCRLHFDFSGAQHAVLILRQEQLIIYVVILSSAYTRPVPRPPYDLISFYRLMHSYCMLDDLSTWSSLQCILTHTLCRLPDKWNGWTHRNEMSSDSSAVI